MAFSYLLHLAANETRNENKSDKRTDAASLTEIKQGAAASSANPEVCCSGCQAGDCVKKTAMM